MKRMLVLASVASMIDQFNMSNIGLLQSIGYEVDVACNFISGSTCSNEVVDSLKKKLEKMNVNYYQIDFARNIYDLKSNLKALKEVKKILKDNKYEFIHCHSPIGGVVGRIAGKKTKTKVMYTAHGFHFFKGGPIKNWILYYPIEKILSKWTDVLITINNGDYNIAIKKMKAKQIEYIPGVGVDLSRFSKLNIDVEKKRMDIGVPSESILLLSVGEVNKNKNHEVIIRAIAEINNPKIHYAIAGKGPLEKKLMVLASKLGLSNNIHLLGFRKDIVELNSISDIFCFPSRREGLGIAALEAMACELPIITSNVNGINDYSIDGETGFKASPTDIQKFKISIEKLVADEDLRKKIGEHNLEVVQKYNIVNIMELMKKIYNNI